MKNIQTFEDVYPAIDELIIELKTTNCSKLGVILDHRLHRLVWSTRAELFEELKIVLTDALQSDEFVLIEPIKHQVKQVLWAINAYLQTSDNEAV